MFVQGGAEKEQLKQFDGDNRFKIDSWWHLNYFPLKSADVSLHDRDSVGRALALFAVLNNLVGRRISGTRRPISRDRERCPLARTPPRQHSVVSPSAGTRAVAVASTVNAATIVGSSDRRIARSPPLIIILTSGPTVGPLRIYQWISCDFLSYDPIDPGHENGRMSDDGVEESNFNIIGARFCAYNCIRN